MIGNQDLTYRAPKSFLCAALGFLMLFSGVLMPASSSNAATAFTRRNSPVYNGI